MRHFNINGASPAYPTDCFARYNLIVTASTRQTIPRDKGNEIKTHTDMDMEIDVEKIWGGSTSLSHHFVCWWPCFSVLWMHSLVSITPCFICLGYPFFSMRTFHSFFSFLFILFGRFNASFCWNRFTHNTQSCIHRRWYYLHLFSFFMSIQSRHSGLGVSF